jgi:hypothetical protein
MMRRLPNSGYPDSECSRAMLLAHQMLHGLSVSRQARRGRWESACDIVGIGLRYRAASTRERSCVLSPISASPTTLVETRNDCMGCCIRAARTERDDAHSGDPVGSECVSSVLPNISCARHEESFRLAKCVDVRPRTSRSSRLHPNEKARFYRARCYRIKSPDWKLRAMTNVTRRVCGGPLTACRGCSRGTAVR